MLILTLNYSICSTTNYISIILLYTDWTSSLCYTRVIHIAFSLYFFLFFLFFFSRRRRHTRFKCDWSSDVCSSDLDRREQILRVGGVRGGRVHHQVELVELLPHLRRDDLAHGAGVLSGAPQAGADRVDVLLIESQELDDVALGGRAVPFRESRGVAGRVDQRLPLLGGANGQVEHEVEVHLDEPRDVLGA